MLEQKKTYIQTLKPNLVVYLAFEDLQRLSPKSFLSAVDNLPKASAAAFLAAQSSLLKKLTKQSTYHFNPPELTVIRMRYKHYEDKMRSRRGLLTHIYTEITAY